jgi:hypothetical protein
VSTDELNADLLLLVDSFVYLFFSSFFLHWPRSIFFSLTIYRQQQHIERVKNWLERRNRDIDHRLQVEERRRKRDQEIKVREEKNKQTNTIDDYR